MPRWRCAGARDPARPHSASAAFLFPYLEGIDPFTGAPAAFPPSGSVAGIYAANDQSRGVWKAAAGLGARVTGVTGVAAGGQVSDALEATLAPLGVDCLRAFPGEGVVVWGARTFQGEGDPEWRYVPVRRTALHIAQSIQAGVTWTVFEPNAPALWASLQSSVGGFLQSMFQLGAFQGRAPRDAYLVMCDGSTTTPAEVAIGIVNIIVGFAPIEPAEFVLIKITAFANPP